MIYCLICEIEIWKNIQKNSKYKTMLSDNCPKGLDAPMGFLFWIIQQLFIFFGQKKSQWRRIRDRHTRFMYRLSTSKSKSKSNLHQSWKNNVKERYRKTQQQYNLRVCHKIFFFFCCLWHSSEDYYNFRRGIGWKPVHNERQLIK